MSATSSSSLLQPKLKSSVSSSFNKYSITTPLNVAASVSRQRAKACALTGKSSSAVVERKAFLGTNKVRGSGSEKLHLWQTDGPGKTPKLRVVVKSALSGVPEKPLGLYDPSFDKDSCGVGFVAELSGERSRKTVWSFYVFLESLACTEIDGF